MIAWIVLSVSSAALLAVTGFAVFAVQYWGGKAGPRDE